MIQKYKDLPKNLAGIFIKIEEPNDPDCPDPRVIELMDWNGTHEFQTDEDNDKYIIIRTKDQIKIGVFSYSMITIFDDTNKYYEGCAGSYDDLDTFFNDLNVERTLVNV